MSAISSDWLPHRDYSHLIKYVKYVGYKGNTLKFFVPNKFNGWNTYIQFKEWNDQVTLPLKLLDFYFGVVTSDYIARVPRIIFGGCNTSIHSMMPLSFQNQGFLQSAIPSF
jgi:hypothetical protein